MKTSCISCGEEEYLTWKILGTMLRNASSGLPSQTQVGKTGGVTNSASTATSMDTKSCIVEDTWKGIWVGKEQATQKLEAWGMTTLWTKNSLTHQEEKLHGLDDDDTARNGNSTQAQWNRQTQNGRTWENSEELATKAKRTQFITVWILMKTTWQKSPWEGWAENHKWKAKS